jgi:hypothetical protein
MPPPDLGLLKEGWMEVAEEWTKLARKMEASAALGVGFRGSALPAAQPKTFRHIPSAPGAKQLLRSGRLTNAVKFAEFESASAI